MPAAVAVPLIMGAASTGAQVVASKMASNTAKKAAAEQQAAAAKAQASTQAAQQQSLQFLQQEQARKRAETEPYRQFGLSAMNQLGQLTGLQTPQQPQPQGPSMGSQMGGPPPMMKPPGYGGMQPGQQGGDMVTLKAPTGETRQVPRNQAQAFVARGAQIVS